MIRATFTPPWVVNNRVLQRLHACAAMEETSWSLCLRNEINLNMSLFLQAQKA